MGGWLGWVAGLSIVVLLLCSLTERREVRRLRQVLDQVGTEALRVVHENPDARTPALPGVFAHWVLSVTQLAHRGYPWARIAERVNRG